MSRIKIAATALMLSMPFAAGASPIAIGDEVNVSWDFPSISTPQCGAADVKTTTVAADASDAVTVLDCAPALIELIIDMNTSGFTSTWELFGPAVFGDPFDGIVISAIDWTGGTPGDVLIDTNLPGWAGFGTASLTADSLIVDFSAIDTVLPAGNYYLTATVVPEPATLALLGIGLFAIGLAHRRRRIRART